MIGLIVGIFMLRELKSDDPESEVCCVDVGRDVEVPVVDVGNPPNRVPRLPDVTADAVEVGLGVGDAPLSDPPLAGIPPGGTPFCGMPPGGDPCIPP